MVKSLCLFTWCRLVPGRHSVGKWPVKMASRPVPIHLGCCLGQPPARGHDNHSSPGLRPSLDPHDGRLPTALKSLAIVALTGVKTKKELFRGR